MSKINKKDFIFDKKKDETLIKVPGQINGRDFVISNLEGCEVYLMDHIAQIFVDDCKNCTIHIGPVESSIFIRDCQDLKVSAACSQYRISDSSNIDSYVYAMTDPTLEKCRNVRFAPYNFAYPLQNEHFEKAKLDPKTNKWSQIFDFNENKQDPNWFIIPPEEYPGPVQKTVDDLEAEPENPVEVNVEYGGTLNEPILIGSQEAGVGGQEEQGGMMAFDIHTGAQQAAETFEQQVHEPVETHEAHEEQQPEEYHHDEQPQEHDQQEEQPQEHYQQEEQPQEHYQHEEHYQQEEQHHEEEQHYDQGQPQDQGYEQNQDFGQPQAQDFGVHDQGDFGYQSQHQVESTNYQSQPAAADYDDFFGGSGQASQPQAVESSQYTTSSQPVYEAPVSQPVYEAPVSQPAYGGGYGQQAYGGEYDPEEEERLERLRRLEQERFRKLEEKARIERERKQERISNGARELNKFHNEREQQINKRKELNRQNQEIQSQAAQEEYKNPWDKIVANIATKEGEYPGTKDVTRFRQALINKKMDAAKGLNTGMPDF